MLQFVIPVHTCVNTHTRICSKMCIYSWVSYVYDVYTFTCSSGGDYKGRDPVTPKTFGVWTKEGKPILLIGSPGTLCLIHPWRYTSRFVLRPRSRFPRLADLSQSTRQSRHDPLWALVNTCTSKASGITLVYFLLGCVFLLLGDPFGSPLFLSIVLQSLVLVRDPKRHVKHFCETSYIVESFVLFSPVTVPVHCRLWNVEWGGMQSVERGESGVLSGKSSV